MVKAFVVQRWTRRVGWATLFWRDLLLIGTSVQLMMTLVALVLLSRDVPMAGVLAVHLSPLPYGLFIVVALWRAVPSPALVRSASLGWLALSVMI